MNRKFKNFLKYAGIVLLSVALSMGCLSIYNYFNDRDLNPDNLLKYEDYYETLTTEWEKGSLKAKWNENGSFVLTGKYEDPDKADTDFLEYPFATISLPAGTYTFDHGNDNCTDESYYIRIASTGTTPVEEIVCDEPVTFTLDETANVSFSFKVKNNYRILYAKFEPVLVKGETAGEFFAKD